MPCTCEAGSLQYPTIPACLKLRARAATAGDAALQRALQAHGPRAERLDFRAGPPSGGLRSREGAPQHCIAVKPRKVSGSQVATNEWVTPTTTGSAPPPRVFHSTTVVGQNLIVVGGAPSLDANATPLLDTHVLDLKSPAAARTKLRRFKLGDVQISGTIKGASKRWRVT